VLPNPWDRGSARLLEAVGFVALASTSSGHAASLGRADGDVTRDEVLEHLRLLSASTSLPLSADLEDGYGAAPEVVADTVRRVRETGVAGCSIEDYDRERGSLYDPGLAVERIRAAVEAIAEADPGLVLTARAENYLRGQPDLADTISRLQAFQEAGAEVLYAPGLRDVADIRSVVESVDRPVNVLLWPGGPDVNQLGGLGVRRVSVGGALSLAAHAALVGAARELLTRGTATFWNGILPEAQGIRAALEKG